MTGQFQGWRRIFFGIRTRLIAWCAVLIAGSQGISVLAVRQVLSLRLQERGKHNLLQEIQEFRQLLQESPTAGKASRLSPSSTGVLDTPALFDTFLSRNIPDDGEFMLALLDGQLYKSSPVALPESLRPNSKYLNRWAKLTQPEKGELVTPNDTLSYWAEPVTIQGKTRGVFVVIQSAAGDWEKVNETTDVMLLVTLAVSVIACALTWIAAGRVLAPLRSLTATANSISESNVSQRIPVRGSDEIAELAITFNEMLDRLQAALTSQRNFISDAGHELRTPITIIRGHLELLGDDPQERAETVALVLDELERMSRLVNDLLLLAKAERPDFLTLETVGVSAFTEEVYAKVKALGDRDWQLESQASGKIVADRQRLTQALMNLAQNAAQHTSAGDEIVLGSALTNGHVRFWVRDTGTGIAPEDRERIFQRFARAANSRRRSEGAGLGLAIVSAIAEAHGGRVEVESQLGKGSTFTLAVPVNPPFDAVGSRD
ncbi:sensor histidine kinase [Kamptonema formosum]|uniref:sensor histidine kinase n=1 Tax=Kamptonema formosum TaxID=331992 RepID=UPI000349F5CB|nr:ATP-binding protein [Oscillatoria sp. PCC 10802]